MRLPISTSPPSRKMMDRNPSHFGSNITPPSGRDVTAFASMGAIGGISGSRIGPILVPASRRPPEGGQRKACRAFLDNRRTRR